MRVGALAALLLAVPLLAACRDEPEVPTPPALPVAADVVLRIGEHEITEGELSAYLPFLRHLDTQAAPAFLRRILLQDYVLPRRIAHGLADPGRMTDARQRAESLAKAVSEQGGSAEDLMRLGEAFGGMESEEFMPPLPRLPIDMAKAAWDCPVGGSTGAIETIYGVALVGVLEERARPRPLTGTERRLYTVFFPWSQDATLRPEVQRRRDRLLGEFRYVHPAYRDEFANFLPVSR